MVGDENCAERTEYDGFGANSVIFRTLAMP